MQGRRHVRQNKPIAALHLGTPRGEKFDRVQALWLASAHSMSYWAGERLCLLNVMLVRLLIGGFIIDIIVSKCLIKLKCLSGFTII